VTAVLRGDVDLGFDYYAALEGTIGPDKLQVIATLRLGTRTFTENVPTAKESGMPDYVVTSWNGVGAPADVPAEIISALSTEIRRALESPDVRDRMLRLGLEARRSTPEEMRNRMAADATKVARGHR
jgi:tripartite-type tricarboxylate transporter receptor subunit TctC